MCDATELIRFIDKLFTRQPSNPGQDIPFVCALWREFTGSDWVWLWMFNHITARWELRSELSSEKSEYLPLLSPLATDSVAQYCVDTNTPVFVDDFEWTNTNGDKSYRVKSRSLLEAAGCVGFISIPFIASPDSMDAHAAVASVLCVHYKHSTEIPHHNLSDFSVPAKVTANFLTQSFHAKKQRILDELNGYEFDVDEIDTRPHRTRKQYVKRLVSLLSNNINASAVSLFLRSSDEEGVIECIASTADLLQKSTGRVLKPDELSEVKYKSREGATGQCFALAKARIFHHEDYQNHQPMYVESNGDTPISATIAAFCPIPAHNAYGNGTAKTAVIGVIRCVGLLSSNLNTIDLDTLSFVCRHAAPFLESLDTRIVRERTISIVKHDLIGPISLIRHLAEDLISSFGAEDYNPFARRLLNLNVFALKASNLVLALDPEIKSIHAYNPSKTLLEGDVVARVSILLRHIASSQNVMKIHFGDFAEADIPALYVDKELIERVFFNLVVNAIKYGKSGTVIKVVPRVDAYYYIIDVINEGRGVAELHKDKIFRENYRANIGQARRVGLGLGLFIARKAMMRHGGNIILTSARNPTVFSMLFPLSLRYEAFK